MATRPKRKTPTAKRSQLYRAAQGAPARVFRREQGVSIEAFEFDFTCADDDEDLGYILVTNGMSDRPMHLDAEAQPAFERGEIARRAELIWYVRELAPHYITTLRWLAAFPFIDTTWLGFGHTIPMPGPMFPPSKLTAFLFLTPIIGRHARLFDKLRIDREAVELLTVHLLTRAEYELKMKKGVGAILDLFDAADYPFVLDERRASLVPPRRKKRPRARTRTRARTR
jgi:hypothetical protein